MKRLTLFFLILLCWRFAFGANAAETSPADKAQTLYGQRNYAAAEQVYSQMLAADKGTALDRNQLAQVYYNLGNCHYRLKNFGRAVWAYQNALRLDPSDQDAAFNLELTQTKIADRFTEGGTMFFAPLLRGLMRAQSATAWGVWGAALLLLGGVLFLLFRGLQRPGLKKLCFFPAVALWALCLCCLALGFYERNCAYPEAQAVVLHDVAVYANPTLTSAQERTLHEGTLLSVVESQKDGWMQVVLPDGKAVWIRPAAESLAKCCPF